MKKFAPIVAIIALGAMFTSCKKEYTCECTMNGTPYATYTIKNKKSAAQSACDGYKVTVGTTTVACDLK